MKLYYRLFLIFLLLPLFSVSTEKKEINDPLPTKEIIEEKTSHLEFSLVNSELNKKALDIAFKGYLKLKEKMLLKNDTILTIIDYSKPSTDQRLYIIDIKKRTIILKSLVAHGKNSGVNYATSFSNKKYSNQSSLGFFITDKTYIGKHGYSLRIIGLEKSNDNAYNRSVVIHSASYVNEKFIEKYGRLGRSFGCPAIPLKNHKKIIDLIKEGTCLFIYYPKDDYLMNSSILSL